MNISKKLAAFCLASGITITSLAGCGQSTEQAKNKSYILEGTMLDHTVVATIEGETSVFRSELKRECGLFLGSHYHYVDIVSGNSVTDFSYCSDYLVTKMVSDVENSKEIMYYLTEDELKKAMNNELTDEDLIAIVYRIKESQQDTVEKSNKTIN